MPESTATNAVSYTTPRDTIGSIVKFGCHIGHSYTSETMASAQFDELEKVMRAAVRFLNERAEFCLQMAESGPGASTDWHAASKQALDRAYRLRDLVEQDWIVPETSGEAVTGKPPQISG
jgi:two-component system chemotaxis response regulator CheB